MTSIGARWGLTNPAHLSRLFRDAYGLSPTEYRAQQLYGGDGAVSRALTRNRCARRWTAARKAGVAMLHLFPHT